MWRDDAMSFRDCNIIPPHASTSRIKFSITHRVITAQESLVFDVRSGMLMWKKRGVHMIE